MGRIQLGHYTALLSIMEAFGSWLGAGFKGSVTPWDPPLCHFTSRVVAAGVWNRIHCMLDTWRTPWERERTRRYFHETTAFVYKEIGEPVTKQNKQNKQGQRLSSQYRKSRILRQSSRGMGGNPRRGFQVAQMWKCHKALFHSSPTKSMQRTSCWMGRNWCFHVETANYSRWIHGMTRC